MIDETRGSRMLTPAERDEAMAEALKNWDAVEDECRQHAAQATAHQAAREAARVAAGLQQTSAAELATMAQLERDFEHQRHRESQQ